MEMEPIKNLFAAVDDFPSEAVADLKTEQVVGVKQYITHARNYYQAWDFVDMDMSERLEVIRAATAYFTSKSLGLPSCFTAAINITLQFVEAYPALYKSHYPTSTEKLRLSHISTLCVENFFSTIRAKEYHPSFFSYGVTYQRAWMEMVKRHAKDRPFPIPDRAVSQVYNRCQGLEFVMADIPLVSPTFKRNATERLQRRTISPDTAALCSKLAETYPIQSKRLSIRQSTCKDLAFSTPQLHRCQQPRCEFTTWYRGCLSNHLRIYHDGEPIIQTTSTSSTPEPPLEVTISYVNNILSENEEDLLPQDNTEEKENSSAVLLLDTETTGTSQEDEIIQIAFIDLVTKKTFSSYVKPKKATNTAYHINRISNQQLRDQNEWPTVWEEIQNYLQDKSSVVVYAHNAAFDARMIRNACARYKLSVRKNKTSNDQH